MPIPKFIKITAVAISGGPDKVFIQRADKIKAVSHDSEDPLLTELDFGSYSVTVREPFSYFEFVLLGSGDSK